MKIHINKDYKSINAQEEFELPNFVVLTGKNGSGKSHLTEVMSQNDFCTVSDESGVLTNIKYIGFNGLNPQIDATGDYMAIIQQRKDMWLQIQDQLDEIKRSWNNDIYRYLNFYDKERTKALQLWVNKVKGDLGKLTEDFVLDNYEISSNEMFSSQFASIFKLYQIRYDENEYFKYKNATIGEKNVVLSETEFESKYGPKPWNLINNMLERARLPYRVNHPEGHRDASFNLKLSDINTGIEIQVNDLSTGEKVLMSLALSIYNSNEEMARPDVLLLDEPDAPLHPEFSKVFISAVIESIVKKAGVKVIISTHSPTTVAIAPEDSLYRMDKILGHPQKTTKEQAISILIQDLENVRLSFDNRRQVFVESNYDVQYYNRIFRRLLSPMTTFPQFLPPRSSNGANCDEVSGIVNALRGIGNDLVYGIKDFDNKNHSSDFILVLGEDKRYAIDNYIFDPIYVGFLLVRENIIKTENIDGLPSITYVALSKLKYEEVQILVDYIIKELGLWSDNTVNYDVQDGKTFKATSEYFTIQGHSLEEKIKDKWPKLKSIARGGDNILKNHMLDTVIQDYPQYLSMDFVELFTKIK